LRPRLGGKIEMQAPEWSEAANGDRDPVGHARPDSGIEQDPPAGHFANID